MRSVAAAAALLVLTTVASHASPPAQTLLDRASAYVSNYQQQLAMVVAQERYDQEVRYPAPPMSRSRDLTATTILLSDFLLVRGPDGSWVPFRDVFERDGVPVRDRQERLSTLFLNSPGTALEQARRIVEESTRYNIGNLTRTINVPTLGLIFLSREQRDRFDFEEEGGASRGVKVLRYRERRRPTYIRTSSDRDLPVSGRYWIDEATGCVERTELRASDDSLDARITVTFRDDAGVGLWVPERMEERYAQKNDHSEIRGVAVYSRYRRFQITTTDELAH